MQNLIARIFAFGVIGIAYLFLPLMPLVASVVFFRRKYLLQYPTYLKKMAIHIRALREGPVVHYFEDVVGRIHQVPEAIEGSCVQCGNCCMEKRCVFLEDMGDTRFQCGIYHSPLRRFSNCGSFPINAHDIERYACPSYSVVKFSPRVVASAVS